MNNNKPLPLLNIFVHIPKTAGETFKQNIEASLPQNSFLRTSFNYFEPYYNAKEEGIRFFEGKDSFTTYVNSLHQYQKEQIKCLGGHDSYYGIHKHFEQQPRYIAFFRNPIARTISLYNYERMAWEIYSKKEAPLNILEKNFLKRMKDNFLVNNRVPSFERWLEDIYDKKIPFYYSMARYLQDLGFLTDFTNSRLLSEDLNKFYFVGITERFHEDAFYLYQELGVNRFVRDTNNSTSYVSVSTLDKQIINKINARNEADFVLYEAALKKNEQFRKANSHFYISVNKMKGKKWLFFLKKVVLRPYKMLKLIFR